MSVGHHLPLQLRLIATVAAALVITASLSVVPVYWHAKSKVATEMQAALAVGERVALNEIQTVESARDLSPRLELMIAHFNGDRHLKVSLVSAAGGAIVSSRLAPPDDTAPKWFARFIGAKPLTKSIPLTEPIPPLAAVVIEADPTNEVAEAWTDLTTFAGILSLFCLLVLGLVSWIVTRAIRPIQSLLAGYSALGSGNLSARVTPSGSPELEGLCIGFNDMGSQLQHMAERNARLTQQLEAVQEEERADLARDLHDEVSPLLFAADVDAVMIAKLAKQHQRQDITAQTESIRSALKQLKKIVTLILGRLRPAILLDQGLSVAIDNLVSSGRQRHPNVAFTVDVDSINVDVSMLSALFFVIREAVSNALRHGEPETITIDLRNNLDKKTVVLQILDDGHGTGNAIKPGFGVRGMEERIASLGGKLTVAERDDGPGVVVRAHMPYRSLNDTTTADQKLTTAVSHTSKATKERPRAS